MNGLLATYMYNHSSQWYLFIHAFLMVYFLPFLGGIVALGKFDALHVGHRELAIEASKIGSPFLLSFIGMEEILGWPSR